ncbi:terminase TerL endonuclease subunit [Pseudonocardia sp. RS010]|uniref:terminase TerL endonuclease subunit n=1 Tax=Pseudonocardia sp. RS010 TaxID=3385979 RepID=UPI0039A2A6EE
MKWPETDLAERAEKFISTYCRSPKGYGYGKPLRLAPFQREWLRQILAPGVTAAVDQMPRGQGKSTFHAALAVWALFDRSDSGEPQIPIIATRVQQAARSVYDPAVKMVQAEPELASRSLAFTAIGTNRIVCEQTGGELFPMANNPDGLQGLDPSLAIVDEIGFQSLESWESVILASGKRPRSLVVGVGTPGFDRDNALWHLRSAYLEGRSPEGFVFREHSAPEGCDIRDEEMWRLANPALDGGYQNIAALRTAVEMSTEAHFRTFHLGQWVDGTDAWLGNDGRKTWDAIADPSFKFVKGAPTWLGLDVGLKHDSTALVMLQYRPDGRIHAACKLWMPAKDDVVDVTAVMEQIRRLDRLYKLVEVAYDPRHFEFPATQLADEGIPMTEMNQSLERMTPAFGTLYEVIKGGKMTHDGDSRFGQQVLNGIPRYNERGFTLMKAKSRGKIDAAYALAMAYDRAQHGMPKSRPDFACL